MGRGKGAVKINQSRLRENFNSKLSVVEAHSKSLEIEGINKSELIELMDSKGYDTSLWKTKKNNHKKEDTGKFGKLVEYYITGSLSDSEHKDCSDGDIKSVPIKGLYLRGPKAGTINVSENTCISSISSQNLMDYLTTEFQSSSYGRKIAKILFVPRIIIDPENDLKDIVGTPFVFDLNSTDSKGRKYLDIANKDQVIHERLIAEKLSLRTSEVNKIEDEATEMLYINSKTGGSVVFEKGILDQKEIILTTAKQAKAIWIRSSFVERVIEDLGVDLASYYQKPQ